MPRQITKRGNSYQVQVAVGKRADGKPIYCCKSFRTRREAQEEVNRLRHERTTGAVVIPDRQTVAQHLDAWLAAVAPRVRGRTHDDYTSAVRLYLKPALGGMRLTALTSLHLDQMIARLHERGLAPRTIAKARAVLHTALAYAVKRKLLLSNPAAGVELPRREHTERVVFNQETAKKFVDALRGHPKEALYLTLLLTGLRPEEVLALRWTDMENGQLSVNRVLIGRGPDAMNFAEPKTRRSRRRVPLPTTLLRVLEAHRRRQAQDRLAAGPSWPDQGLIFCNRRGGPLRHDALRKPFRTVLKRAGLPVMRLYDLRHSQATLLLMAGESPKVVAERLGHSSTTLTLDTYSHVLPDMQERAVAKLDIMFG